MDLLEPEKPHPKEGVLKGYLKGLHGVELHNPLDVNLDCIDVNAVTTNKHGFTPLHEAVANNQLDMVQLLLSRGAQVGVALSSQQMLTGRTGKCPSKI